MCTGKIPGNHTKLHKKCYRCRPDKQKQQTMQISTVGLCLNHVLLWRSDANKLFLVICHVARQQRLYWILSFYTHTTLFLLCTFSPFFTFKPSAQSSLHNSVLKM